MSLTRSASSNNEQQQHPPPPREGEVIEINDSDEEEDVEEVVAEDQERALVSNTHRDLDLYDTNCVYRWASRRTQKRFPGALGWKQSTYEGLASVLLSIPPGEWLSCGWLKDVRSILYGVRCLNAEFACTGHRT
jgi:hypothetical protein